MGSKIDPSYFEPVHKLKNILYNLAWNGTYTDAGQTVISDYQIKEAKASLKSALLECVPEEIHSVPNHEDEWWSQTNWDKILGFNQARQQVLDNIERLFGGEG